MVFATNCALSLTSTLPLEVRRRPAAVGCERTAYRADRTTVSKILGGQ